nr:MAG: pectate lyase superfamily protein [Bacteriophage sp.]
MATTPTNKPIPSEDPRDLKFNAGKLDEVISGDAPYYTDRFGVQRWTIAGMQYTASQAIAQYGYITVDSFQAGATLTLPNQALRDTSTGEYYRWDGAFPPGGKVVTAGSTPASSGGVGTGAWLSVGDAVLRSQISNPDGATLYPELQIARWRDEHDIRGWGGIGNGIFDNSSAIELAVADILAKGGGPLFFPAGRWMVSRYIPVHTKIHYCGAGREATRISAIPGSNTDVFKTWNFDDMTGTGNINEAPYGFSITSMTITGNYLKLDEGGLVDDEDISWRVADTVLNSQGSAMKIFGTGYDIDVEVYNVAEHAIYGEAIGTTFNNKDYASRICITGRISGKEAIVWRGPGDIFFEYIVFGLGGLLPLTQRSTATTNTSTLYPTMPVHGIVLDNASPYTGHVEIGLVHIYAISYGYGVYTLGTNRFNATHVVSENNLGGYYFGSGAHGVVSIAESRANGRMPDSYAGSAITPLPDVVIDNGTIWQITGTFRVYRYSPSQDLADYAIQVKGSTNNLNFTYASQLQSDSLPLDAGFLSVTGNSNRISFQALRVKGNGVMVSGTGNNIQGSLLSLYSGTLFTRNGAAAYANIVSITATGLTADSIGFNSVGVPASENLKLVVAGASGYTPFTGEAMAATNRAQTWEIACTTGNSINGKSTEDYIEARVPSAATSGTFTVAHNFLYAPNRVQVALGLNFPGTAPNQHVQLGIVGQPTSTDVTISYLWNAIPTSGAANVQIHIK